MKKTISIAALLSFSFYLISNKAFSQQINLYSIANERQNDGDNGYTLDGARMINSRSKLLSPYNFGSAGTYPQKIIITDAFPLTGSLVALDQYPNIDILFIGSFNKLDPSLHQFSDAELDTLYQWSKRGGKLIIAPQASNLGVWDFTEFDSRWGFSITNAPSDIDATTEGNSSDIFNGPFGHVNSAHEGGSAQGYFSTLPANAVVLGRNVVGQPTLFLDCNTFDLICADVDAFTDLGGISFNELINNDEDRYLANTMVYMDKLEQGNPPVISVSGNIFSTGTYLQYQWFQNGNKIAGATNNSFSATDSAQYSVKVTYQCGCTSMSLPVSYVPPKDSSLSQNCKLFIPSAFSPDGNGKNDILNVIQSGTTGFSTFHFEILNRWGQSVFETTDMNVGWDGTFKGEKQPCGVFAYYCEATCANTGERIYREGTITLVR